MNESYPVANNVAKESTKLTPMLEILINDLLGMQECLIDTRMNLENKTASLMGRQYLGEEVDVPGQPEQPFSEKTTLEKIFTVKEGISREIQKVRQTVKHLDEAF